MAKRKLGCAVEGCSAAHDAKGYCRKHYARWRKNGDPLISSRTTGEPSQFLIAKVLLSHTDECVTWPFAKFGRGYGQITISGARVPVHRAVCEIINGPPPSASHQAAHSCGNGHLGCVNPRHVRWATPKENMADRIVHGTDSRGTRAPSCKLSEDQVRLIRKSTGGRTFADLGREYGVDPDTIAAIVHRKTWAWLDA